MIRWKSEANWEGFAGVWRTEPTTTWKNKKFQEFRSFWFLPNYLVLFWHNSDPAIEWENRKAKTERERIDREDFERPRSKNRVLSIFLSQENWLEAESERKIFQSSKWVDVTHNWERSLQFFCALIFSEVKRTIWEFLESIPMNPSEERSMAEIKDQEDRVPSSTLHYVSQWQCWRPSRRLLQRSWQL